MGNYWGSATVTPADDLVVVNLPTTANEMPTVIVQPTVAVVVPPSELEIRIYNQLEAVYSKKLRAPEIQNLYNNFIRQEDVDDFFYGMRVMDATLKRTGFAFAMPTELREKLDKMPPLPEDAIE